MPQVPFAKQNVQPWPAVRQNIGDVAAADGAENTAQRGLRVGFSMISRSPAEASTAHAMLAAVRSEKPRY